MPRRNPNKPVVKAKSAANELSKLSAAEVARLTRSGELKVVDYATALLARIKKRDSAVHAWVHIDADNVMEYAKLLDSVPADNRRPLHGVAVGVKDVIYTSDQPTRLGSAAYNNHPGDGSDAAAVATLRAMGALIFGKTHTTEFACSHDGPPTNNPLDQKRTPGGSSSGSAAAVSDFQVPIALGSQTGGSTIRPASYTGIYGFKPTYGAISRDGVKVFALSFDTVGLFARSIDDIELLVEAFLLKDDAPLPPTPLSLKDAKFGFVRGPTWDQAEQATIDAMAKTKEALVAAGATVEDVDLPAEFNKVIDWHKTICKGEGRASFWPDYLTSAKKLTPSVRQTIEDGMTLSRSDLSHAIDGIAALRPKIDAIAGKYTALITPSVAGEAPLFDASRSTGSHNFNALWTALHVPVVNVPAIKGPEGMPVGISVVAPRYHDQALVRAARAVAEVLDPKSKAAAAAKAKEEVKESVPEIDIDIDIDE